MHHSQDALHPLSSSNDPFVQGGGFTSSFLNALVATALFRCWHLILFFSGWAAAVCLISDHIYNLSIQTTLITVFGTVLGFVISYRTSSSFERYNEGRRYWSSIVYASRILARTIWFHVPYVDVPQDKVAEMRAATVIEKKSAINLIEAFAVAVKHYLRGEETIYYEDLYQLVRFLPVYILPAGRPSLSLQDSRVEGRLAGASSAEGLTARKTSHDVRSDSEGHDRDATLTATLPRSSQYPPPPTLKTTSPTPIGTLSRNMSIDIEKANNSENPDLLSPSHRAPQHSPKAGQIPTRPHHRRNASAGTNALLPARDPPKYALFDVFPFSLFVKIMVKRGKEVKGKKGAKLRARTGHVSHNIPLELTFYLSSYISELQRRKILDVPTLTNLMSSLNTLVDSLTGLERILTTPIPFSYSIHLWVVTATFSFLLPFQLWTPFKYLTIPATAIATFVFFGFLVAGEEIENPFGYDKNDLNLDHFTNNIIRVELNALTSRPTPDLSDWAFNPENKNMFGGIEPGVSPQEWMSRVPISTNVTLPLSLIPTRSSEPYDPYVPRGGEAPSGNAARPAPGNPKTAALQADIDRTVDLMQKNIAKVAERGERLDDLQDKTDNLAVSAQGFRRGANRVRKNMWWKDMKMRIIIAVGVAILLVIIIVPIVKSTQK